MHPTALLALLLLTPSALAVNLNSPLRLSLLKRQDTGTCSESGYVVCGNDCMPSGDNCCNSDGDYCPSDETCATADNGVTGCCPEGESCTGNSPGEKTVSGATLIGGGASSFTSLPSANPSSAILSSASPSPASLSSATPSTEGSQTTAGGGGSSSLALKTTFASSTATAGATGAAPGTFASDPSLWALLLIAAGNMLL